MDESMASQDQETPEERHARLAPEAAQLMGKLLNFETRRQLGDDGWEREFERWKLLMAEVSALREQLGLPSIGFSKKRSRGRQ